MEEQEQNNLDIGSLEQEIPVIPVWFLVNPGEFLVLPPWVPGPRGRASRSLGESGNPQGLGVPAALLDTSHTSPHRLTHEHFTSLHIIH